MLLSYYDNVIRLANDIWIGSKNHKFDLGYKKNIILSECTNFSYLSNKFIVLKKNQRIYVYSTNILIIDTVECVEKLLEFTSYSKNAYGKIILERGTYLIDSNCQIKFSDKSHIN